MEGNIHTMDHKAHDTQTSTKIPFRENTMK